MRAWCPHCGALNEFDRPPTTAIVYCQHCRKPFGAAALTTSNTPPADRRKGSNPPATMQAPNRRSSNPGSNPGTPPAGVPKPKAKLPSPHEHEDQGREPTVPFRKRQGPVAAAVIVPKGRNISNAGPIAKIVYRSPDGLETDFVLDPINSVGRHPKNKIRLNDREISKEHAIIERRNNNEWWIKDLRSSNGTYINSRRITEHPLNHNDEILLGSMRLMFIIDTGDDKRDS